MPDNIEIIKQVKINEATVTLRSDGIVHVMFHKKIVLDVALQMLMITIYNEITERKKHPFLYEALPGVKVTKEARDNAMRIETEAPGNAYAVVAKTIGYRIVANFYLNIKKTINPYKVFSNKEDAVEWLRGFVQAPLENN